MTSSAEAEAPADCDRVARDGNVAATAAVGWLALAPCPGCGGPWCSLSPDAPHTNGVSVDRDPVCSRCGLSRSEAVGFDCARTLAAYSSAHGAARSGRFA